MVARYENVTDDDVRKTEGVTFYVSAEELEKLDAEAKKLGMNRSAYLRFIALYNKEG